MEIAGHPLSALILAAALGCARAALAGQPAAMPTAPATASDAPPSVADQIDAYLKASPALALPTEATRGVTSGEEGPRKAHGVVDVAVGSNGYRSAYVRSDVPLGK